MSFSTSSKDHQFQQIPKQALGILQRKYLVEISHREFYFAKSPEIVQDVEVFGATLIIGEYRSTLFFYRNEVSNFVAKEKLTTIVPLVTLKK
jgi:hypothetical protein